jgi:hypothetical protein
MSKVFSANVFLSSSKDAVDKLFFGKTRFRTTDKILSILTEEEIKDSLLVTPNINPGLIDLDFNFNNQVADSYSLTLRFLETNSGFEAKYIESNVSLAMLKRLAADSSFNSNLDYSSLKDIRYIYFSFGIGSNLKDWAGPYKLFLKNSNILIDSNGVKTVELVFQSHGRYLQTNNIIDGELDSIATSFNRYNRFLTSKSLGEANATTLLTYEDIELKNNGTVNITQIISELLARYISQITRSKNVIVMLPDLQSVYDDEFQKALEKSIRNPDIIPTDDFGLLIVTIPEIKLRTSVIIALRELISKVGIDLQENIEKFNPNEFKILGETKVNTNSAPNESRKRANFLSPIIEENQENQAKLLKKFGDQFSLAITSSNYSEFSWDYYAPLQSISDNIKRYWKISSPINLREEINIGLTSLWKEEGYIDNDTDNVYIFGVKELIDNTLYCAGVTKFDDIFNKNITKPVNIYAYKHGAGYKSSSISAGGQGYASKYFDLFIKDQINSSFGENVLIGDELSLDKPKREAINKLGIPIFKHNFNNSNVISLEVKFLDNLVNMYDFAFQEEAKLNSVNLNLEKVISKEKLPIGEYTFYQLQQEVTKQLKKSLGSEFDNSFETLLSNVHSILRNLRPDTSLYRLLYSGNVKDIGKVNIANFAILLTSQIYSNRNTSKPHVNVRDLEEAITIRNSINNYLSRTAASVTVKTLPFFKLSGELANGKTVALFSKKSSLIGSTPQKGIQEFSGLYLILGNRHVITSTECYSEFQLVRPAVTDVSVDYENFLEENKEKPQGNYTPYNTIGENLEYRNRNRA